MNTDSDIAEDSYASFEGVFVDDQGVAIDVGFEGDWIAASRGADA